MPVYEEISQPKVPNENLEMGENVAYGPVVLKGRAKQQANTFKVTVALFLLIRLLILSVSFRSDSLFAFELALLMQIDFYDVQKTEFLLL